MIFPKSYLDFTIYNGIIFISEKYLQESLYNPDNNNLYNFIDKSKIFLTIIHEIAHKIQYLTRMKFHKRTLIPLLLILLLKILNNTNSISILNHLLFLIFLSG